MSACLFLFLVFYTNLALLKLSMAIRCSLAFRSSPNPPCRRESLTHLPLRSSDSSRIDGLESYGPASGSPSARRDILPRCRKILLRSRARRSRALVSHPLPWAVITAAYRLTARARLRTRFWIIRAALRRFNICSGKMFLTKKQASDICSVTSSLT